MAPAKMKHPIEPILPRTLALAAWTLARPSFSPNGAGTETVNQVFSHLLRS